MQVSIPMIAGLSFFSFLISFPCGYIRYNFSKYSFSWFLWIHIPIPFILLSRYEAGFDWHVIPLTLLGSVLGQLAGGFVKRNGKNK